jgi:hypothetical protein
MHRTSHNMQVDCDLIEYGYPQWAGWQANCGTADAGSSCCMLLLLALLEVEVQRGDQQEACC